MVKNVEFFKDMIVLTTHEETIKIDTQTQEVMTYQEGKPISVIRATTGEALLKTFLAECTVVTVNDGPLRTQAVPMRVLIDTYKHWLALNYPKVSQDRVTVNRMSQVVVSIAQTVFDGMLERSRVNFTGVEAEKYGDMHIRGTLMALLGLDLNADGISIFQDHLTKRP